MTDTHVAPLLAAAAGATASASAGPLSTIFDELGLTLAIMGAIGGIVSALATRTPLIRAWRSMIVGGLMGFGFGVAGPWILKTALGWDLPPHGSVEGLAAAAFVIGLLQERLLDYLGKGTHNA